MNWFKHDTGASNDAKIKRLILQYGAEGYAIYFHCLELIAGDLKETNITFELEHDAEIIADNLKIKGDQKKSAVDKVNEIMRFVVHLGLFECTNDIITCYKLAKRLDQSMTGSVKMRQLIDKTKAVMTHHDGVMKISDGIMQEEKRREENREDNILSGKELDGIPYQAIIDDLNQQLGTSYRSASRETQRLIHARWVAGFRQHDFAAVVRVKKSQWENDAKMRIYLRPVTLFGTKFESYLQESQVMANKAPEETVEQAYERLVKSGEIKP